MSLSSLALPGSAVHLHPLKELFVSVFSRDETKRFSATVERI